MTLAIPSFDEDARGQLLRLSGLTHGDLSMGPELQRHVIEPRAKEIISVFYARMLQHPEVRAHIPDPTTLNRLQRTQTNYLLSLGVNFASAEYFEERYRVGVTHARVGISLGLYQLAGHWLGQCIEDSCTKERWEAHRSLLRFARSVLALDMAIATEAYHEQQLGKLRNSLATLREKVRRDPLTGMASREHIQFHLAAACDTATDDSPVAIVVADLDRFKQVNDTFGHLVGDEVLQETARRIAHAVRDADLVGRWGGEEFLLVLRESDARDALRAAERIRRSVNDEPVKTTAGELRISISQGVAVTKGGEDPRSLIERADQAMYEAKRRGRNRVVGPGNDD